MTALFIILSLVAFGYLWKKQMKTAAIAQLVLTSVLGAFLLLACSAPVISALSRGILGDEISAILVEQLTAPYWHSATLATVASLPILIGEAVLLFGFSSAFVVSEIVRKIKNRAPRQARTGFAAVCRPSSVIFKKSRVCYLYCSMNC